MSSSTSARSVRTRRGARWLGLAAAAAAATAGLRSGAPGFLQFFGTKQPQRQQPQEATEELGRRGLFAAAGAAVASLGLQDPAEASRRLAYPPIDKQAKGRCKWVSSAMGQANAQRDKLLDLRECDMHGQTAKDIDIAGVLMNDGNFEDVNFENTVMSKAVVERAKLDRAVFKDAVLDRVTFDGSSLKGANFNNAVLTGATFDGADLENSDWTDASLDTYGVKPLCKNPTMKGTNPVTGVDTRESAGCDLMGTAR